MLTEMEGVIVGAWRKHVSTVLVVVSIMALFESAPVIAHGIEHALLAHNAEKLDGLDSKAFQRECKDGSVLAFARISPNDVSTEELSRDGATAVYNCAGSTKGVLVRKVSEGRFTVRFPGLMPELPASETSYTEAVGYRYVVATNVEGAFHDISTLSNVSDVCDSCRSYPVIDVYTRNSSGPLDVSFSITLMRVIKP